MSNFPRYSLRSLLGIAVCISIAMGILWNTWWRPMQERASAVARLKSERARMHDRQMDYSYTLRGPETKTPPPETFVGQLLAEDRANQAVTSVSFTLADEFATDEDLEAISVLKSVQEIDVTKIRITPIEKNGRRGQKHENIGAPQVTDAGIAMIAVLPHLKILRASGSQMTDDSCALQSRSTSLEILAANDTQISDAGLALLVKIPSLKRLSLSQTRVTRPAAKRFRELRPDVLLSVNGLD